MKNWYERIKRHGSAIGFVLGFVWDNLMLGRIDHWFANLMLGSYLCVSAASILVINMHENRKRRTGAERFYTPWLPIIVQFCFGSLFSAYIIFYTQSASLAVNWPFLVFLILLVAANEFLRRWYLSPAFQLCVFFIVLFSYSVFTLPIILGRMGGDVFLLSGLASLAIIACLGLLIRLMNQEMFAGSGLPAMAGIIGIYALFNLAYFTNIIPPVPLSLKEIGVYHKVARSGDGNYILKFEPGRWYPLFKDTADIFNRQSNEPVYVFSSVFAPAKLSVPIYYTWSYFDQTDKVWVMTDRFAFPLVGGREGGYRGYTVKTSVFPATWRVDVETARHERVGREEFQIAATSTSVSTLVTETR